LKITKILIALLFSAVLMAGQFSFVTPAPAAQTPAKGCCTKHCCCTKPTNSQSVPQPVAPTRTISQTDWQLVAAVAHHLMRSETVVQPVLSSHSPKVASLAVPLYQRNCTFLI
jgi:hypothetical protein